MESTVKRRLKLKKYIYEIGGNNDYYAESNYNFNIGLRKITIFDKNEESIYTLKQTNWLLKAVSWITSWFLPIDLSPKYKFYDAGVYKGETKWLIFTPRRVINIDNTSYELHLHSNNYISVMKNNIQVALIKKSDVTIAEQNQYSVNLDNNLESNMILMFLFTVFADIIYYPNRCQASYWKYEKTIGFDKCKDRTLWKPHG